MLRKNQMRVQVNRHVRYQLVAVQEPPQPNQAVHDKLLLPAADIPVADIPLSPPVQEFELAMIPAITPVADASHLQTSAAADDAVDQDNMDVQLRIWRERAEKMAKETGGCFLLRTLSLMTAVNPSTVCLFHVTKQIKLRVRFDRDEQDVVRLHSKFFEFLQSEAPPCPSTFHPHSPLTVRLFCTSELTLGYG